MSDVLEQVRSVMEVHPDWGRCKIAEATGLSDGKVRHAMAKIRAGAVPQPTTKGEPLSDSKTISVNDILSSNDTVGKTLAVVGSIPNGEVMHDDDVRKQLGLGVERWRRVRGSARLVGHFAQLPDKSLVWGRKTTIEALSVKLKELL